MEVLRTEDLTREYGFGDNKVVALNHVSFSVEVLTNRHPARYILADSPFMK